jgi:hypothetical protein
MGKHWEKAIRRSQDTVASVGQRPEETEPWSRERIASFVAGFALSAAAQRQIVEAWTADAGRAQDAGWESHADSVWYDEG